MTMSGSVDDYAVKVGSGWSVSLDCSGGVCGAFVIPASTFEVHCGEHHLHPDTGRQDPVVSTNTKPYHSFERDRTRISVNQIHVHRNARTHKHHRGSIIWDRMAAEAVTVSLAQPKDLAWLEDVATKHRSTNSMVDSTAIALVTFSLYDWKTLPKISILILGLTSFDSDVILPLVNLSLLFLVLDAQLIYM